MGMMGTRVTAKPSQIRMFLRADSAEELVRLQLQTNLKVKGRADFTDFTYVEAEKTWYCWFMVDIDQHGLDLFEELNGIAQESV